MNTGIHIYRLLTLLLMMAGATAIVQGPGSIRETRRISDERFRALTGRLPLPIEETGARGIYHGRGGNYHVEMGKAGFMISSGGAQATFSITGGRRDAVPETTDALPGRSNYFIGNDPRKWLTDVRSYRKVVYRGMYDGIDLAYYGTRDSFEYDFIVAPGSDPGTIRLKADREVSLTPEGDLLIDAGSIRMKRPFVYQELEGGKHRVDGGFEIGSDGGIGFQIGEYDRQRPLVIDPIIEYATYYGGSGTDVGYGIAVDRLGNMYVTGQTSSLDFPQRNGFYQMIQGANDAFVMKLNSTGTTVLFATYIGGRNPGDRGWSIEVDDSFNIWFAGETNSLNYPTVNAAQPLFRGNVDAFLTRLNSEGNAIVFSTYLGGSLPDVAYDLTLDGSANCYITGRTDSDNFPVVEPIQGAMRGNRDVFVSKFDRDGTLVFSTFYGGDAESASNRDVEAAFGIAIDRFERIYITGFTSSQSFPEVGGLGLGFAGVEDAFVVKFDLGRKEVVYSTLLGGTRADNAGGIAVDDFGNAYITGYTLSTDFPVRDAIQPSYAGNIDGFVTKISASGRELIYSTYLGGGSDENTGIIVENVPSCAIEVDRAGNAFISGKTASADFPVVLPIQPALRGDHDLFAARIDPGGSRLVFSTFFGSSFIGSTGFEERATGMALSDQGRIYLVGQVLKNDLFTILPAQSSYGGGLSDVMILRISTPDIVTMTPVSAAGFAGGGLAPASIVSLFGVDLAAGIEAATSVPLPTSLLGTTVTIVDSAALEVECPIFFVSPNQINALVPAGTASGRARLIVTNAQNTTHEATVWINTVAPGIFTADASGQGLPAALLLRVKADGTQSFEPVAFYDAFGSVFPAPISFGDQSDQLFLILFATGVRNGDLSAVKVSIDGIDAPVLYAGEQGGFVGLDQINLSLPRQLAGKGSVQLRLEADHWMANQVRLVFQ